MIVYGSNALHKALLHLYNLMWRLKCISHESYDTTLSYNYKGKGDKDVRTSYQPIAPTSTIINLLKKMILVRIAECVMPHVTVEQGGGADKGWDQKNNFGHL